MHGIHYFLLATTAINALDVLVQGWKLCSTREYREGSGPGTTFFGFVLGFVFTAWGGYLYFAV